MSNNYKSGTTCGTATGATSTSNSTKTDLAGPKPDGDVKESDVFSQMNQNEEDTLLVAAQDLFCCLALNPNTNSASNNKATVCVHPVWTSCTKSLTIMPAVSPPATANHNNPMSSFLPTPLPRFTTRLRNIIDNPIITHYLLELNTHPNDGNDNDGKSILPLHHMSSKTDNKTNSKNGTMAGMVATAPSALPARTIG